MRVLSILPLALALGCDPTAFGDLEDEAGTRVLEAPDNYPRRGYGKVVATLEGELGGESVSRIATTGGDDTPYVVYEAWAGDHVELDGSLFDGCKDDGDCEDGAGASLVPIPVWRAGDPFEGHMCLLIASPPSGTFFVRCEDGEGNLEFPGTGREGIGFGAAGASLGAGNTLGVALIGAPSKDGHGAIYLVPDGAGAQELEIPDGVVAARADLGAAIAAGRTSSGATLIAAGAPGDKKVVVLVASRTADGIEVELRACLTGDPGFGGALAIADLDADGAPEIIVGHSRETESRGEHVAIFDGAGLPDADSDACAAWDSMPERVVCPDGTRSLSCDGAEFGSSIAVGDLDADDRLEMLVGAPGTTVDGSDAAGAVFVFRGGVDGIEIASPDALTLSKPESDDELGASLATVRTFLGAGRTARAEVVAGAPGADAVAVFLCSGLDNDDPDVGTRCVPD